MPISKARRGSAYIMVLAVTMLIFVLVAIALSITVVSMRATTRYPRTVGLYDLAVAGNEQALFLLNQRFYTQREYIANRAWERVRDESLTGFVFQYGKLRLDQFSREEYERIFIRMAMSDIEANMGNMFTRPFFDDYWLIWGIDAIIGADGFAITDSYRAETRIRHFTNFFTIDTRIRKYIDDEPDITFIIDASTIWTPVSYREIILDAYTIEILEYRGISVPLGLDGNFTLFLDEFALTMVESIRLAEPRP